jgi:hypothetical protein
VTRTLSKATSSETTPFRRRVPAVFTAGVAALATIASLSRPLSFDEMYWLTMARRIFQAGDLPYFDLLDNKGPLLYVVVGMGDFLPLNARGVFTMLFVLATVSLAAGGYRLALAEGQPRQWALYTAGIVAVGTAALSVWAVTSELLTAAVLVWALVAGRPWIRVTLVLAACLIDPRAVLLAPIVLWHGMKGRGVNRSHILGFESLGVVAVVFVLAIPELRYAFVEASLATRFDANAVDVALVTAAAVSPLLAFATLRLARVPGPAIAVLVVALAIGLSAGLPYGHYWVYLLLALPLLPILGPRFSLVGTGIVSLGAVLVLSLSTRDHFIHDLEAANTHHPIAVEIEELVRPDDRVLVWASSPHLRFLVAPQTLGFAPTSNYFGWGLPQSEMLLERLEHDLERATVVVSHPGLEDYRGLAVIEEALDLVAARTSHAECSIDLTGVTFYRFSGC